MNKVAGMLRVERKVLDIDKVLQMGMTFRWRKHGQIWHGVIGRNAVQLEQKEEGVAYSCVNSNSGDSSLNSELVRFFDLERKYEIPHDDANLTNAVAKYQGIRQLQLDPIETLYSFICSSNNHISRISSMMTFLGSKGDLLAQISSDNDEARDLFCYQAFPSIEKLAELTEQELREANFGYRAKFIVKTSASILENGGDAWVEALKSEDYAVAVEKLMSLAGIGRKVADCIALYGLNKRESVPLDVHLIRLANRDYNLKEAEKGLTPSRYEGIVARLRETWGRDAGWVQTVLFYKELQLSKEKKKSPKSKTKTERPKIGKKEVKVEVKKEPAEIEAPVSDGKRMTRRRAAQKVKTEREEMSLKKAKEEK